ncbi:MAG: DEAD/DEAH box helicase, partial [Actinomycetota bacterium]
MEILGLLQGAPLPASVLEADVLPARMAEYRPSDLDALCTAGEVVWVGAGALGSGDGRVRLLFRDQVGLLAPAPDESTEDPTARALLDQLDRAGASFWPELVAAASEAGAPYDEPTVLASLWDLVWAGSVTNDSLAPVRALSERRPSGGRGGRKGRPRPGRLTRLGPPSAAGRWSLVAPLRGEAVAPTAIATARAGQLLERYGVLTREAALGEGAEGGFAGVYPVLKELEERGQVRRGYFIESLGGAQFALPGAVDRLRGAASERVAADAEPTVVLLAATDPAQPYGAALPWPETTGRPGRVAGAHVVLIDGEPAVFLERGAKSLVTFPAADRPGWAEALRSLVDGGRLRSIEIGKVDGAPVAESGV